MSTTQKFHKKVFQRLNDYGIGYFVNYLTLICFQKLRAYRQARLNHKGRFRFVDRSSGNGVVLIIVAGYKPYLWDMVFPRIRTAINGSSVDVCIVLPGRVGTSDQLERIAEDSGWSFLQTRENKLALAQNLAITLHESAKLIFKIDEDIFLPNDYFKNFLHYYDLSRKKCEYSAGLFVPLINVNGHTYLNLLEKLGVAEEYDRRFDGLLSSCIGIDAHQNPKASLFLWESVLPFDLTADRILHMEDDISSCPHRFSIGAIMIERDFWEELGGFKQSPLQAALGVEEEHICMECSNRSRPIVVFNNILVGHFSFGPQTEYMLTHIDELKAVDPNL